MIPFMSSYMENVSGCPASKSATYIEAVEFWYPVLRDKLRDGRISFAAPAIELRNAHDER